ncbi:MAG: hypothetical protein WA840_00055 [Caulobacteraceae bacterium]
MSNAKVSVMDAVRAAADFARTNVRQVAGVLGLVMALNIASSLTVRSPLGFLIGAAGFLASIMANAAMLRLAFADEHPGDPDFRIGPQGVQWGRPELRLLGAMGLLALFLLLAGLFAFIIAVVVTVAVMVTIDGHTPIPSDYSQLPTNVQLTLSVLLLIFLLAVIWALIRVCLYPAATVAEKRVQVFSTWALTRGQFWRILGALAMIFVPFFLLFTGAEALQGYPAVQTVLNVLLLAASTFVVVPMGVGLYAYLYRHLRHAPPPVVAQADSSALAGPWGSV